MTRVLVAIALLSFSTVLVAYGIGMFGGVSSSPGEPYTWDQESPIVVVVDEGGFEPEAGCMIETESGQRLKVTVRSPSILDISAGSQQPVSDERAEVVCGEGRVFTGFAAFLVNFRTAPLCAGVPSLLTAGAIVFSKRTSYRRHTARD